jgi:isopentenyl-diphosphate delta-isomerase
MEDLIPTWIDNRLTPFDKLETHRLGLRHKAVSVFVMRGDQTLIQRRALAKYHTPGLWANSCCTHPHWGESSQSCAVRRLDEELGVSGVELQFRGKVEYRADVGGGLTEHEVVSIYRGEATAATGVTPNPAEVIEVRWVALNDLIRMVDDQPALFTPWLRIYLQQHLDLILN